MTANGTAVVVVNVTGAAIQPMVPVASKDRVSVASNYGAVFIITVRVGAELVEAYHDRGTRR